MVCKEETERALKVKSKKKKKKKEHVKKNEKSKTTSSNIRIDYFLLQFQ